MLHCEKRLMNPANAENVVLEPKDMRPILETLVLAELLTKIVLSRMPPILVACANQVNLANIMQALCFFSVIL
jgi:hypothetical protein